MCGIIKTDCGILLERASLNFKDARLEKSNALILDAALVAFAEEPNTTFTELSKLAGVGRATLYRIYPTRESLIEVLLLKCLDKVDDEIAKVESKALSLRHFFELFFMTIIDLEHEFKLMFKLELEEFTSEAVRKRCLQQESEMRALVEQAKSEKIIDRDVPSEWVLILIEGIIDSAWAFNRAKKDSKFVAKIATRSLLDGVGASSFFKKKVL